MILTGNARESNPWQHENTEMLKRHKYPRGEIAKQMVSSHLK
jgi:hypothetical protein